MEVIHFYVIRINSKKLFFLHLILRLGRFFHSSILIFCSVFPRKSYTIQLYALIRITNWYHRSLVFVFILFVTKWQVNGAGDHLLRSLLGSLVLYYPIDQYKYATSITVITLFFFFFYILNLLEINFWSPTRCVLRHPAAFALEDWISTKDYTTDEPNMCPKWHVPSDDEVKFAEELLNHHFQSALDDLLRISQTKMHSDLGNFIFCGIL